jgi:anti-sigma28 factor (negative regulator of flagellin synthesis)
MTINDATANLPVAMPAPQVRTIPALERRIGRTQRRVTQVDQLTFSPRLREIQQAGQMLIQMIEIRDTTVVALRKDVETGQYSIKAEQVAEKLMQDHLLVLFSH